jgi:conjugative transfer region protein (TIGR03748 family)
MRCLLIQPMKAPHIITPLLISIALVGCVTTGISSTQALDTVRLRERLSEEKNAVSHPFSLSSAIRYGRYTLASTSPRTDQIDLLGQIIDIRIPSSLSPSVHDAMAYVLLHSGYRLCTGDEEVRALFAYPLPASHYHLGPIAVRDALSILAGNAWELEIKDKSRTLCFTPQTKPGPSRAATLSVLAPANSSVFAGGHL